MQLLVFGQDIVVLLLDEGNGFFGIIYFTCFAKVTQGNEGGYTATCDEAD